MRIKVVGDPFSVSGYSLRCREIILALISKSINVSLDFVQQDSARYHNFSGAKLIQEVIGKNNNADISLQVMIPSLWRKLCKYNIGTFYYEADKLPKSWVDACNQMDLIIVSSDFMAAVCISSGVTVPVRRVREVYSPAPIEDFQLPPEIVDGKKIFLSVFRWEYRKGWDILLRSFWSAFKPEDNVSLVIKTYGQDFTYRSRGQIMGNINAMKNACWINSHGTQWVDTAPIFLIFDQLSDGQVRSLYDKAYAFVLPSRGEGWGRIYLDAVSAGKPIIATGWSAHMDYLNHDNAYLVDYNLNPCMNGGGHPSTGAYYPFTSKFAEPSIPSVVDKMREVVNSDTPKLVNKSVLMPMNESGLVDDLLMVLDVGNESK